MKRVLVTGGAGFIAHHLIDEILIRTDWEIVSLDRLDYSGNLNRLHYVVSQHDESTRRRLKVVYHDLKSEINSYVSAAIGEVDYILHHAAGSHVDRSIQNPLEFVMDNVVGTCNILNFARTQKKLERFVYFSTDEVFGPAIDDMCFKETDRYNSTNPYSASKAGGEELTVAYHNTYDVPCYIIHTMNVFGERQHPEKYIPMCIEKIYNGETVTVHADKTKTLSGARHYIHARDVADAMLFLLNKKHKLPDHENGIRTPKFNLVGPEEITNLELAQLIAQSMGKPLVYEMVDYHAKRPGYDLKYNLSGEKMKLLGWQSHINIKDRINQIVQWSLDHKQWLQQ
jgi:dTDP-glucose 4,6-dehydratase